MFDRTLAEYGPETKKTRELLRHLLTTRMQQIWPIDEKAKVNIARIATGAGPEVVQPQILALVPQNDAQRWLQATALQKRVMRLRAAGLRSSAPVAASNGRS